MRARKNLSIRTLKRESREGRRFTDLFLVLRKNLTTASTGRPYLRVTLGDSSDSIEAFVWEGASELDQRFSDGDIVEVRGSLKVFQGTPQIVVESLHRLGDDDLAGLEAGDFLPASKRPRPEMWAELRNLLAEVANPFIGRLLGAFFADAAFCEAFQKAPAATGFHHAYVGGLLEHTLGVVRLARAVAPLYRDRLDPDALLAGAFLHDVGKVQELSFRTGFDYTDAGRLVGHIVLGARLVREKAGQIPGFPEPLILQLEHLILSHHGEKEWGAPTVPQTLEALLLHYLDNVDAKLCGAWEWMEKERATGNRWTTFWKGLGRQLFLPSLGGPEFGEAGADPRAEDDIAAHFLRAETEGTDKDGEPGKNEGRPRPRKAVPGQGDLGF
jgi:3'-5' exoribonuclease